MNCGNLLLYIAFIANLLCAFLAFRNSELKYLRLLFNLSTASIVAASSLLLFSILSHDFSNAYVFENSSNNMPLYLLLSTFFAGQEGAFLFWNLCMMLCGLVIINNKQSNTKIIKNFTLIVSVFLLLVLIKSPFASIWEKYPDHFPAGVIPLDGRSINPLLESIWMAIHPPILFVGYSLLTVASVLYLSFFNLKQNISIVRFWQNIGTAVLGLGIILGGIWAYQSLGWGGFWGWDPVENVSLIPWLLAVVLIHGSILERKYNQCKRLNYILHTLQLVSILYSAFVTRTGIAQDSMHTFAGESNGVFWILLAAMIFIVIYFGYYLLKLNNKEYNNSFKYSVNYPTGILFGMYLLSLIAVFVFIGTTLPIVARNFAIDVNYYNTINLLPLCCGMFLICLLNNPKLKFDNKRINYLFILQMILSVIIYYISDYHGSISNSILLFLCLWLAVSSIISAVKKTSTLPAALAHLGLGIMFFGVVLAASKSDQTQIISLLDGTSQPIENAQVGYIKSEKIHAQNDREKYRFIISVTQNNTKYLYPVITVKNGQIYKEPAVYSSISGDIYVSPLALDSVKSSAEVRSGERFTFEYSYKPYMVFVFIGAGIMISMLLYNSFKKQI